MSSAMSMLLNQSRKSSLPCTIHEPYTFVRTQESPDIVETSSRLKAKLFWMILWPLNLVLFQMVMMPPEAPSEGMYSKLSYARGQKFLINARSKHSLFVSCKQMMS
jgi:hypothetical protein